MKEADQRVLAIEGGAPLFEEPLHVGRPSIGDRKKLMERIEGVLDRRWFTNNGPLVQELEAKICEYLNVRNCMAVCNGTVGLEIAIRGLGMSGEVIVPSFTFVATAHSLWWQGIEPVFCDVDPLTHQLDPSEVEKLITPKTKGILGVHLWGRSPNARALETIARKHGLPLLFDAAHAFGCSSFGVMAGGFGNASVFSFHATKFFNTFEGGAIVTNDDELAEKIRLMRNFGFAGFDKVVYPGLNGKMSEVSAAMGLTGMDCLSDFLKVNLVNYEAYARELSGIPGISVYPYPTDEGKNNFQYVVVEIDPETAGLTRDQVVEVLQAENVLARRYFFPGCHRMEPYATSLPTLRRPLPHTEKLTHRLICLPTGPALGIVEIEKVCDVIAQAVNRASEIRLSLRDKS